MRVTVVVSALGVGGGQLHLEEAVGRGEQVLGSRAGRSSMLLPVDRPEVRVGVRGVVAQHRPAQRGRRQRAVLRVGRRAAQHDRLADREALAGGGRWIVGHGRGVADVDAQRGRSRDVAPWLSRTVREAVNVPTVV